MILTDTEMTDHTELIERLQSRTASMYLLEDVNLFHEAADALEAAQAEIERLTTDRRVLQADGKHPAPCAKFCEATAFTIELRRVRAERDKALARLAELSKQEPVGYFNGRFGVACAKGTLWAEITVRDALPMAGERLYSAAGAAKQPRHDPEFCSVGSRDIAAAAGASPQPRQDLSLDLLERVGPDCKANSSP